MPAIAENSLTPIMLSQSNAGAGGAGRDGGAGGTRGGSAGRSPAGRAGGGVTEAGADGAIGDGDRRRCDRRTRRGRGNCDARWHWLG